ncbi:MAG TPA: GPW/gp25 family protein [Rhodocyclaceae bacterium]|nr:GPW/gp25 family protein [Rhodocyclaceae bacterium]
MSARTGRHLDEDEHISQSISDILNTPVGSRIKRREYGSLIPDLIDQPASPANRLRLMSATVMAVMRWEPRVAISSTTMSLDMSGASTVDMQATRRTGPRSGSALNLSIPLR